MSLTLAWDGRIVHGVTIASTRPVHACRVFHDKTVAQTLTALPLLYSVCRRAQSVAAMQACQQALGVTSTISVQRTRKLLVLAEIAQEYLWRFLLDWPQIMGMPAQTQAYAVLRGKLERVLQPILLAPGWKAIDGAAMVQQDAAWEGFCALLAHDLEQNVFGIEPHAWAELATVAALEDWRRNQQTPLSGVIEGLMNMAEEQGRRSVPLMPPAASLTHVADALAADEDFACRPHWQGSMLETGAIARLQRHPLLRALQGQSKTMLARVLARLLELAELPQNMLQVLHAESFGDEVAVRKTGVGQAWVETARGLLLHRVVLAGDVVRRYQILAPTEWNFHPAGVLAQEVCGMRARDEVMLQKKVAMMMLALDPCVGYELRIAHA